MLIFLCLIFMPKCDGLEFELDGYTSDEVNYRRFDKGSNLNETSQHHTVHFIDCNGKRYAFLEMLRSFCNLHWVKYNGYQVNGEPVSEQKYPWIARVVHSRNRRYPHLCTASCVDHRIFITAVRCIYSLKVALTSIIYQDVSLPARAFVVPSNLSKQAFDDIGFVVVEDEGFQGSWSTVKLMSKPRSGDGFQWFAKWNQANGFDGYKAIGYATKKGIHRIKEAHRVFNLTELDVVININLCTTVLTFNFHIKGFYVPCYHSCSLQQFKSHQPRCSKYLGVDGAAVLDVAHQELVGIATWGPYFHKYELPVGFSVPNSKNFHEDFECAKRIRNDKGVLVTKGYYQSLCE